MIWLYSLIIIWGHDNITTLFRDLLHHCYVTHKCHSILLFQIYVTDSLYGIILICPGWCLDSYLVIQIFGTTSQHATKWATLACRREKNKSRKTAVTTIKKLCYGTFSIKILKKLICIYKITSEKSCLTTLSLAVSYTMKKFIFMQNSQDKSLRWWSAMDGCMSWINNCLHQSKTD